MRASTCLNTLERLVGETAMSRIMRTFSMRFRFRHPKTADFVQVANEVSGRNLTWFFDDLMGDTLNFDYGVASVVSEEKPAHPRGVFDVDGKKEEMTAGKAREIEAKAAGQAAPAAQKVYLTTVTLRRFGEARVKGDVQVKLIVAFEDGSQETRFWDGQGRWTRLLFVKPAKAVWAKVDPDGVWLIDSDMANNTYIVRPVRRGLVRLLAGLLTVVQNILQLAGSFS
jgi:hypothetical protein